MAALNAYRSPLYVVVKTTLLVTAAAPYGDDGSLSSHSSLYPGGHVTLPVAGSMAVTFDSRSCVYTTPFTTAGVVA